MGDLFGGVGTSTRQNGNGLEFGHLSALEESEEEDREDEIKQLLADAFNNETFEEESERSFVMRDENDSYHSINSVERNGLPFAQNGIRDEREKGGEEMVAKNETVSVLHTNHCPKTGDHGRGDAPWVGHGNDELEALRSLCDFRERQMIRSEEKVDGLSKDKRALNHQIGLMRTEMIQMKSNQEELQKLFRLKEEETEFLRSKVAEVIAEHDGLRKGERETRDRNSQLTAHVGKLEQEIELLSAIGSSAQQSELDDVVRQIREKHAKEIMSWKGIVKELEAQARSFQRADERSMVRTEEGESQTESARQVSNGTQTLPLPTPTQKTSPTQEPGAWVAEKKWLIARHEEELDGLRAELDQMPGRLFTLYQKNQLIQKPIMREAGTTTERVGGKDVGISCELLSGPKQTSLRTVGISCELLSGPKQASLRTVGTQQGGLDVGSGFNPSAILRRDAEVSMGDREYSSSAEVSSVESQTEETLETYRILAKLIEQWVGEVDESTQKAEKADRDLRGTERELVGLRRKFEHLTKVASHCRREWKERERVLEQKHAATKAHYLRLLGTLARKIGTLESEIEMEGRDLSSTLT